jgi:hypothetical protein
MCTVICKLLHLQQTQSRPQLGEADISGWRSLVDTPHVSSNIQMCFYRHRHLRRRFTEASEYFLLFPPLTPKTLQQLFVYDELR